MPPFPSFVRIKCEAKLITGEVQRGHIIRIHRHATPRSLFHHITPPRSFKKKKMLTQPRTHLTSLVLVCLLCRSIVATRALTAPPAPPPPSFWRVGSSELVAVCTAKGNVSSTRRKMGQNIRTLTAHAQWHRALGLHAPSESDHCVLSYPPPCTWMFPLLTPVLSHLLLMPHNSSRLHSLLLRSSWGPPGHGDALGRICMLTMCCVCTLMC